MDDLYYQAVNYCISLTETVSSAEPLRPLHFLYVDLGIQVNPFQTLENMIYRPGQDIHHFFRRKSVERTTRAFPRLLAFYWLN